MGTRFAEGDLILNVLISCFAADTRGRGGPLSVITSPSDIPHPSNCVIHNCFSLRILKIKLSPTFSSCCCCLLASSSPPSSPYRLIHFPSRICCCKGSKLKTLQEEGEEGREIEIGCYFANASPQGPSNRPFSVFWLISTTSPPGAIRA